MSEHKEVTFNPISENAQNLFVASVLNRASLPQNMESKAHVSRKENLTNREISFNKLVDFVNKIPQEKDGTIRYIILSGWERELVLQAEEILPINPQGELKTGLKKSGSDNPILLHGDIDYLWMVPEQSITRDVWERYHTDGGKSTLPVKLLYFSDISRRADGVNQPDSGTLERYCCRVVVKRKEFIIPRPELIFLEYASHKQAVKEVDRLGERIITPENRDIIPLAKLLLEIDGKYSLDLDLLEEARLKLVKAANDQFSYLEV
jgi:hypothetical protein